MNLAQLLNSDLPIINFDLETDGLTEGSRVVEIGQQVHRPDGEILEWNSYVNPGRPIDPGAVATHGITDARLTGCQKCGRPREEHTDHEFKIIPTFIQLASSLANGYRNCHFSGKNIRFDLGIFDGEFRRARVPWSYSEAAIIDTDRLEALLEPRDLSSLYRRRLGKEPEGAHSALADVRMTHEILVDQLQKSEGKLPLDVRRLHELQWPGWIDCEGKIRRGKDGVVRIQFGKHRGTDVRRVDPSYWSWVLKQDFSTEFKALAARMAKGEFPT